jgi:tricorn protease interacting factor F2/3
MTIWTRNGEQHEQAMLMQEPATVATLPAETVAYKINSRQTGFYRVHYADRKNLAVLGARVAEQSLSVEDRWGIQNDLYALVRQGTLSLSDYLAFLDHYENESAFLPLASAAAHLFQAMLAAPPEKRDPIAAHGRRLVDRVLQRIGLSPSTGESQTTAILRDQLLWQGTVWGCDGAAGFAAQQFAQLTSGQPIHPDIAKAVMQVGAWREGQSALTWLRRRFDESPSEHERLNILTALGGFADWGQTAAALAFTLEKVPPRNRFIPIVSAAGNPAVQDHLWDWYLANLKTLENLHPLLYERVITAIVPYGGLNREKEVRRFAEEYLRVHPNLGDAFRLALENLETNARMRGAISSL